MDLDSLKLGEDKDYWGMLGLLHDIDWALTRDNNEEHCTKAVEILKEKGFDDGFIEIVQSHGYSYKGIPSLKDKKRTKKRIRNQASRPFSIQNALF